MTVGVGEGRGVDVGVGVEVGVGVGVAVGLGVNVAVGKGVGVSVAVGRGVGVRVGVRVGKVGADRGSTSHPSRIRAANPTTISPRINQTPKPRRILSSSAPLEFTTDSIVPLACATDKRDPHRGYVTLTDDNKLQPTVDMVKYEWRNTMTAINVFDRVLKILARNYADSFLQLLLPNVSLRLVGTLENVELAIPEERVDFVHRVQWEEQEYLLHIEFQSEHRADVPERLFVYSALLTKQMGLPVITLVLYLRPREAPLPSTYQVQVGNEVLNRFEYSVVRLWEYADEIADGRWPELSPLLVTLVQKPDERVLTRERELILQEQEPRKRADLLACAVTVGARYFDKEFLWRFFREELEMMKEASFIEDWLEEKLEEGLQQGLQQGLQRGLQQGLQQGFQKGLEQGREQGLEQGLAQGIRQERRHSRWLILMRILRRRFGELPLSLEERLGRLSTDALDTLVDVAITVSDLETFKAQLDEVSSNVKRVTA